jgi:hypothetical protein
MFSEENNMFTNYAPIIIATNLEVSKEWSNRSDQKESILRRFAFFDVTPDRSNYYKTIKDTELLIKLNKIFWNKAICSRNWSNFITLWTNEIDIKHDIYMYFIRKAEWILRQLLQNQRMAEFDRCIDSDYKFDAERFLLSPQIASFYRWTSRHAEYIREIVRSSDWMIKTSFLLWSLRDHYKTMGTKFVTDDRLREELEYVWFYELPEGDFRRYKKELSNMKDPVSI